MPTKAEQERRLTRMEGEMNLISHKLSKLDDGQQQLIKESKKHHDDVLKLQLQFNNHLQHVKSDFKKYLAIGALVIGALDLILKAAVAVFL